MALEKIRPYQLTVTTDPDDVASDAMFPYDEGEGGEVKTITKDALLEAVSTVISSGSITGRSLQERFAEITNVKDYGALGIDTDDTTAIDAAYAACPAGGTLYFPKGIYRRTTTLTIAKAITIIGPGTLKEAGGILAPQINITADGVVIDGLTLLGIENSGTWITTITTIQARCNIIVAGDDCVINRVVMSEKSCGIKVTGDRVRLFQCEASNSWIERDPTFANNFHTSGGFIIYDDTGGGTAQNGTVESCHVSGYGQGISTVGDEHSVLDCFVTESLNNGIYNSGGTRCRFIGNTVVNPHDNGITSAGSLNEIIGNTLKGTLSAVDADRLGNVGIGIRPFDDAADPGTSEALYSTAMGADFNGFGNIVQGNQVSDFSVRGIEVSRPASGTIYTHGTIVDGNTISNCGSGDNDESDPAGMLIYGYTHRITNNSFYSTLPVVGPKNPIGILVTGAGAIRPLGVFISGNTMDGGAANTIAIYLDQCDETHICNNRIERFVSHGIFLDNCDKPFISNNNLPGNDIYMDLTASTNMRVWHNVCTVIGFLPGATGFVIDNRASSISLVSGVFYSQNDRTDGYDWALVGGTAGAAGQSYQIKLQGALSFKRNAQDAPYIMTATDFYVKIATTGACTLPDASSVGVGRMVVIKSGTGVTTTVTAASGDTVEGAGTDVLAPLASGRYISDGGTNWEKV